MICGVIGSVQALEAVKYITGEGELLTGKMLVFEGLDMEVFVAKFPNRSDVCRVCGPNSDIKDVAENSEAYMVKCSV